MACNSLFLASNVGVPNYFSTGEKYPLQGYYSGETRIDVEPDYLEPPSPIHRHSGDLPSAASDPAIYTSAPTSCPGGFFHSEISEVTSMPTNSGRHHSDSQLHDYHAPTQIAHLNVIGTPPPGYSKVDDPPLKRFIKEAHRVWVAPMLAGLPAWFYNWWKKGRKGGSVHETTAAGAFAPLEKVSLSAGQSLTVQIAFAVFAFLFFAFLWYAWLEQRRRSKEDVIDMSDDSLMNNKIVQLVPSKKYLKDLTRQRLGRPPEPIQNLQEEEDLGPHLPKRSPSSYQYPPLNFHSRQRR